MVKIFKRENIEITELIKKIHANSLLSQCIAEALVIARKYNDDELILFCQNELSGWDKDKIIDDKKLNYRFVNIYYSLNTRINTQYFDSENKIFFYIESHPEMFIKARMFLDYSISRIEDSKNITPKNGLLSWTLPITDILPSDKSNDNVICYARINNFNLVLNSIKEELVKHLLKIENNKKSKINKVKILENYTSNNENMNSRIYNKWWAKYILFPLMVGIIINSIFSKQKNTRNEIELQNKKNISNININQISTEKSTINEEKQSKKNNNIEKNKDIINKNETYFSNYVPYLESLNDSLEKCLEGDRNYYDPGYYLEYFQKYRQIIIEIKKKDIELFKYLQIRDIPQPSKTTDFDGRGYIIKSDVRKLSEDVKLTLKLIESNHSK